MSNVASARGMRLCAIPLPPWLPPCRLCARFHTSLAARSCRLWRNNAHSGSPFRFPSRPSATWTTTTSTACAGRNLHDQNESTAPPRRVRSTMSRTSSACAMCLPSPSAATGESAVKPARPFHAPTATGEASVSAIRYQPEVVFVPSLIRSSSSDAQRTASISAPSPWSIPPSVPHSTTASWHSQPSPACRVLSSRHLQPAHSLSLPVRSCSQLDTRPEPSPFTAPSLTHTRPSF
ncbi:hypothetical protein C8Q77DRAFT_1085518 [Trametes polyzona]|nr:hypothetical protein C8Q77DRAFT_1085518 [Trametes polyzona]